MNQRQPRLECVSSSLQLGRGGVKLTNSEESLVVRQEGGNLANVVVAEPLVEDHAATKDYVDANSIPTYDVTGTKLTAVKRIITQATTNNSGVWTITLPDLGQSQVLMVNHHAVSSANTNPPKVCISHLRQISKKTVSGIVTTGSTLVLGGSTLVEAGAGIVVMVEVLVQ